MNTLKENSELYNHLKQLLKDQKKLKFGGLFGLPRKELAGIKSLELNNIPSGKGLEHLHNLKELKLITNNPDIDIDSYINSIERLTDLGKLNLNIPNVRYLSQEQIKFFGNLKNVNSRFNISTVSWNGLESYSSYEMLQINERLDNFKNLVHPLMSEEEKVQRIYHELGNYINFADEQKRARSRNLAGALIDKEAVCQGYSKALETILNDIGIETITVGGQAGKPGDMGHHAWNQVKVNGNWYNMDLTFDSASDKEGFNKGNWKHFLKSDAEFGKTHILDPGEGHPCTDTRFDNREIKINYKPFLRDRTKENDRKENDVEAKAAQNPQQNSRSGFSLNNISQGVER